MSRDVIYQFQFLDGSTYIGKLSNGANVLWTHMKWLPWMPQAKDADSQQSSWERVWKQQILKVGFKNQTFVNRYGYMYAADVERNLRRSMEAYPLTIDGQTKNLFDILQQLWNVEETELCEALCILLATNSRLSMQNTQIDFLSRVSKGRGLTVENIPALVSNSEFQRRYTVAVGGLADRLFFNFKRRDQSVLNELAAAMGIDLEKHRTKTGALSFRSAEMKKLMQALTYRITQRTVDDTLRQLRDNIRVGKHNNEMLQPLLTELEAALKGQAYTASGKLRKITMGELFNTIYSYLAGQAQAQFLEVFSQQTTINLTDTLRTWLNETSLSTVFPVALHGITGRDVDYYKTRFTKWIQEHVFANFTLDSDYTRLQYQKYLDSPQGQRGEAWLPSRANTAYADNPALITQTKQYLPQGNSFMLTQWFNGGLGNSLYGEQVSIWLGATDPFNCWHTIEAFSTQPQSIDDLDRITIY